MGPRQTALDRFNRSYSCSQSVLSAYAPRFGLSENLALILASPFGGGMARQGEICGAVSGALMVIGLACGSTVPSDKEKVYSLAQDFMQRFETRCGSLLCRELTGHDFSKPEEYQAARDQKITAKVCPGFVNSAAEILAELIPSLQESETA